MPTPSPTQEPRIPAQAIRSLALVGLTWGTAAALAYQMAFALRFNWETPPEAQSVLSGTLAVVVILRLAVACWLQRRHTLSRYFSFNDLLQLVYAVTLGSVGLTLADALLLPEVVIPRSVLLLDWGACVVLFAAISCLPRLHHDTLRHLRSEKNRQPAIIVGANDAGEGLLRAIRRCSSLPFHPVGFVDDRQPGRRHVIGGIPVLGDTSELPRIIEQRHIKYVLITSGTLSGRRIREFVNLANKQGCEVRMLPSYEQLLKNDVAIKPREVAIADLLRRPPVELNTVEIENWLHGRTVMVTGSAGSIGSEVANQLLALGPKKLLLVDRSETGQFFLERKLASTHPEVDREVILADLTDRERLERVFQQQRPDIIFHAAAYKHVPLMESHPGEAVKNIVLSTKHMVDLAEEYRAESLVMISTDKAVNPTSVMGRCKRVAEQYVQAKAPSSNCRLETVRFGNVLDSAGSVVPVFRQQIAKGGPVTVTHRDMIRYFMLIPEAAQLVIQAGALGKGGEIFVLDMGEPVRLMDLARDMIRLSGLREGEDIEIKITGLRPGEKLYEELYNSFEHHQPTTHKKIMVAASAPQNLLEVIANVGHLIESANGPDELVCGILNELAPRLQEAATTNSDTDRISRAA